MCFKGVFCFSFFFSRVTGCNILSVVKVWMCLKNAFDCVVDLCLVEIYGASAFKDSRTATGALDLK